MRSVTERVAPEEASSDAFEASLRTNDEVSAKNVWELRGANVFQRLMGNFYQSGSTIVRPTSGYTGIHSMYHNNANFSYSQWPQTNGDFTGDYVRTYFTSLPSVTENSQWWGAGTWPSGVRFPLSQYQSNGPGTSTEENKDGWLERGWLMLDRRTNSLTEGAGHWQVKNEFNTFFTGTETGFDTTGLTFRGTVVWKVGDNIGSSLPEGYEDLDKSAHYIYLWHPSLSSPEVVTTPNQPNTLIPSAKHSIRTLLDKEGRFAIRVPSSWTTVYIKTEQSLWRSVSVGSMGTGGNSPPVPTSTVHLNWPDINAWQTLELAYGDMDGDNRIENYFTSGHSGGRMHPQATDLEQYLARAIASVHLTQINSNGTRINHYHLHVDLNRNRTVSSTDEDVLEAYSQEDVWGVRL